MGDDTGGPYALVGPYAVRCPRCHSRAGWPCANLADLRRARKGVHPARREAARKVVR